MAAAHVGVELLLDGELCHDPGLVRHYHGALTCDAELAPPLRAVVRRLAEVGTPHWYRDTAEVATRLFRILGARPKLAIAAEELDALGTWLRAVQADVRDAAPGLVAELRARLT